MELNRLFDLKFQNYLFILSHRILYTFYLWLNGVSVFILCTQFFISTLAKAVDSFSRPPPSVQQQLHLSKHWCDTGTAMHKCLWAISTQFASNDVFHANWKRVNFNSIWTDSFVGRCFFFRDSLHYNSIRLVHMVVQSEKWFENKWWFHILTKRTHFWADVEIHNKSF